MERGSRGRRESQRSCVSILSLSQGRKEGQKRKTKKEEDTKCLPVADAPHSTRAFPVPNEALQYAGMGAHAGAGVQTPPPGLLVAPGAQDGLLAV